MGMVAFGSPEVGEVVSDGFFRPGVTKSLACKTPVHLSYDGVEAFWVTESRIVYHHLPVELRVSVCNSMCMHEFHSLGEENL